ncbi:MAG: hypothetical protein IKW80_08415, partial [Thermoguttaceae bacterium]|nr:hypothetical protein [Thermoguttaceae bacterium]
MSKKVFNPYRDLLDIPSLKDENPTDYQLLGIDDFESDSGKIAAAHEKRTQRIAELYQLITRMSQQIDDARDRISDSQTKEEYDNYLRKTGRAGVAHLGKRGFFAVLFSFVLSIFIVVISTFYIYPMVVTIPPENYGDSVTTLPSYKESQTQKEIDILKVQQEDVTTMDVNFNLPIDVDADSSVDFLDVPANDIQGENTSVEDLTVTDVPLNDDAPEVEQPAAPEEPAIEEPATDEPEADEPVEDDDSTEPDLPPLTPPVTDEPVAPEETSLPETPAVEDSTPLEEPNIEQPETPEIPEVPEVEQPEVPEIEQPEVPEAPEVPEVPEVEQPAEQEEQTIVRPTEESPEVLVDPEIPDTPPLPDIRPDRVGSQVDVGNAETGSFGDITSSTRPYGSVPGSFGDITSSTRPYGIVPDTDTPTVPKLSDVDNAGIPELPPLEEIASSAPSAAPQPPTIPALSSAPQPITPRQPQVIPEFTPTSVTPVTPPTAITSTGVVLEDVDKGDKLVQIVQQGQKARTDADFAQLLVSARQAEEELMKEKLFAKAQQIADVVYASCARFADKSYRAEAYQHKEIVSRRSAWWDSARAAEAKMASNGSVTPAEANIVARWKIEVEDDWETGLKYLGLSENEQ